MPYTTPITDRSAADITAQNSKAYWNVADWQRVYENSRLAAALAEIMLDTPILFSELSTPTTTTILYSAAVTDFLTFLENIETLRLAVAGESIPGTETEIKYDWTPGPNEDAPNYTHANLWESTIDAIWEYFGGDVLTTCPTLTANLTIPTDTEYVVIDCIDPGEFEIIIEGTGELHVI